MFTVKIFQIATKKIQLPDVCYIVCRVPYVRWVRTVLSKINFRNIFKFSLDCLFDIVGCYLMQEFHIMAFDEAEIKSYKLLDR